MTKPIDEPWANLPPAREKVDWDAIIDADDEDVTDRDDDAADRDDDPHGDVEDRVTEPPPRSPDSPGG